MLKIRLSRTGKKKQPSFRIVVAEHTAPIKGRYLELLGYYIPTTDPKKVEIKKERVEHWISKGAHPTDTVATLLKKEGLANMDKFMEPRDKKKKKKKGGDEESAEAPAKVEVKAEAPAPKEEEAVAA